MWLHRSPYYSINCITFVTSKAAFRIGRHSRWVLAFTGLMNEPLFFSRFIYLFFEREREGERDRKGEGREEEGERILRQTPLWAAGSLISRPIRSWPKPKPRVWRLTDWATQVPQHVHFKNTEIISVSVASKGDSAFFLERARADSSSLRLESRLGRTACFALSMIF